ncbi:uncharacterized protein LOC125617156 [Marmota marmota marmota]|uniref:uncharacterized protein LOC125617156 n=1 Tax=Marmota marmota marmota TaxID=9994 RepID=UPI0020920FE8|nr:uncharacterized protein LOC125617156 [Marmota marmota marmota]
MFQTRWRADRAEKGTLPLHAISHPHQALSPPLPLSFRALCLCLRILARCRLCTATTPSATGRQTASGSVGAWERGEYRKNAQPGKAPHYPIPRHSTRYSNAYPEALHQVMILPPAHGAKGLPGSERQGKVCRAFKVISRSSCLSRRGAAHSLPRRLLSPALEALQGNLPESQVPSSPQTLRVTLPERGGALERSSDVTESIKKPRAHYKAFGVVSRAGHRPAPEASLHTLQSTVLVAGSPETKSIIP